MKYGRRQTAHAAGDRTFMPKPIFQDNGSGMHTHQSLWTEGENLFFDEMGYASISTPRGSTSAGWSPTRRRCWPSPARRPTRTGGSCRLRGADQPRVLAAQPVGMRAHPGVLQEPGGQAPRVPDAGPGVQPVLLAFSAMLMAGLDGVKNKIEPPTRSTRTCTTCRPRRRPA
jgi:glutamine synthetase